MLQKIVTNILMGFKILCQVEDFTDFAAKPPADQSEANKVPSEARLL